MKKSQVVIDPKATLAAVETFNRIDNALKSDQAAELLNGWAMFPKSRTTKMQIDSFLPNIRFTI